MPSSREPGKRGKAERERVARAAPARSAWRVIGVSLALVILLAGLVLLLPARSQRGPAPVAAAGAARASAPTSAPASAPAPAQLASSARAAQLREQFELADHSYCSYREGTRYPNASRPIAEHPDQVYPNRPVTESHPMRKDGGGTDPSVQIHTAQTRIYLAAGEAATFTLAAFDADGRALPLFVTRALARALTYREARAPAPVALAFADDGRNGDAAAGDGAFSGVLAPAQSGLAGFSGTIRTEVKYSVGGRAGVVLFDVVYTAETPAVWGGQVREALENGSLNFYLKLDVRQAGRYLATGRIDDAKGRPFALASFNDTLAAGPNELRLTVFGKLLRDAEAALPLTLRDVDAYLLKENTDPDRALMARLEGPQHVSRSYPLKNFSDAEWQGEERSRYLAELGKDVAAARAALLGADPALAAQAFARSECARPGQSP
ncbi:MAG: choice-of-anchor X domain-containing protein [Pseudomonadota bacterium]